MRTLNRKCTNMNKTCILAFCLLFLAAGLHAQECTVGMLPGERWWGCVTDLGVRMPFDASTELSFDLARQNFNNSFTLSDGEFFELYPGRNQVYFTGIYSSVFITPNWWMV